MHDLLCLFQVTVQWWLQGLGHLLLNPQYNLSSVFCVRTLPSLVPSWGPQNAKITLETITPSVPNKLSFAPLDSTKLSKDLSINNCICSPPSEVVISGISVTKQCL